MTSHNIYQKVGNAKKKVKRKISPIQLQAELSFINSNWKKVINSEALYFPTNAMNLCWSSQGNILLLTLSIITWNFSKLKFLSGKYKFFFDCHIKFTFWCKISSLKTEQKVICQFAKLKSGMYRTLLIRMHALLLATTATLLPEPCCMASRTKGWVW